MTARKQKGNKKPRTQKSNAAQAAKKQADDLKPASVDNLNAEGIAKAAESQEQEKEQETVEAASAVEAAKSAEGQAAKGDGFFYLNGKPKYWRNTVYVPDIGRVNGQVKEEHFKKFFARAPQGLELKNWLADTDLVQERIANARKKMKAKTDSNKE